MLYLCQIKEEYKYSNGFYIVSSTSSFSIISSSYIGTKLKDYRQQQHGSRDAMLVC